MLEVGPEEGGGASRRRESELSGGGEGLLVVAVGFDDDFGGFKAVVGRARGGGCAVELCVALFLQFSVFENCLGKGCFEVAFFVELAVGSCFEFSVWGFAVNAHSKACRK